MSIAQEQPASLVRLLRQPAYLTPQDSLLRAVETLRYSGMDLLPVVDDLGGLSGVFDMRCLRPVLGRDDRELRMTEPVSKWMRRPETTGRADMSLDDVLGQLAASGETALFIIDRDGRYAGAVTIADILSPAPIPVRPPHIGGMATPWGVYLTNGSLQAGVGNLALIGSGVLMTVMALLAGGLVEAGCRAFQSVWGIPVYDLYNGFIPTGLSQGYFGLLLLRGLSLAAFLILMRLLPLSGYHAAEHQAVHAMERGEPLIPQVVKRMPRVHPRCGTNLMAGLLVFGSVSQGLPALQIGLHGPDSALIGAVAALFSWRSVGAFLQLYFTTRPASDKQIASGIAAATDLQRKFLAAEPRRPTFWKRLWCMGLLQMMIGFSIGAFVLSLIGLAAHITLF